MHTKSLATVTWRRNLLAYASLAVACFSSVHDHAAASPLSIEDEYTLRRWGVEDGLPEGTVTAIEQFPDGYLWLIMPRQVVRFDGMRFETLDTAGWPEERPEVLRGIYRARGGDVWIYGDGGAVRYDGSDWEAGVFEAETDGWRPKVYWIREAPDSQVWAATERGLCRFSGDRFVLLPLTVSEQLVEANVSGAAMDERGGVWLAAKNHLLRFEQGRYAFVSSPFETRLDKVAVGPGKALYVHAYPRLCVRDERSWRELTPLRMTGLAVSSRGEVWLGAVEGLARLRDGRMEQLTGRLDEVPTDVRCVFAGAAFQGRGPVPVLRSFDAGRAVVGGLASRSTGH